MTEQDQGQPGEAPAVAVQAGLAAAAGQSAGPEDQDTAGPVTGPEDED